VRGEGPRLPETLEPYVRRGVAAFDSMFGVWGVQQPGPGRYDCPRLPSTPCVAQERGALQDSIASAQTRWAATLRQCHGMVRAAVPHPSISISIPIPDLPILTACGMGHGAWGAEVRAACAAHQDDILPGGLALYFAAWTGRVVADFCMSPWQRPTRGRACRGHTF
jgi:hypothetical protein